MTDSCRIEWLGRIEYGAALKLQKELVAQRAADQIPNTLLLLEHPHTYTIGIDGHREHLLISQDEMARLNIGYYKVDRGGSVAYYGPGQLVAYPILNLSRYGYTYHDYIDKLTRVIIQVLSFFKVRAFREQGQSKILVFTTPPGSFASRWSKPDSYMAQIATIGVKVNEQDITSHGFALNVHPNLEFFDLIIPSGLYCTSTTSLRRALNKSIDIGSVIEPVIQSFCKVFDMEPIVDEVVDNRARNLSQQKVVHFHKGF